MPEHTWPGEMPPVVTPVEAGTAEAPDGRRLVFLYVPQAADILMRQRSRPPSGYTYRWGYHPGHRVHILLIWWHGGESLGVAIPEGPGDSVLGFMTGVSDVFLTQTPVQERLRPTMGADEVAQLVAAAIIGVPDVKFERRTAPKPASG